MNRKIKKRINGMLAIGVAVGSGALTSSCGSQSVTPLSTPSDIRAACFSNRCVQIMEGLGVGEFKYFPAFQVNPTGPQGLEGFTSEIAKYAPTLLIVPKGKKDSFGGFSASKLELGVKRFDDLIKDISVVSVAVDRASAGERLIAELTALSAAAPTSDQSALWIGGAAELGGGFWNMAPDGSESQELLSSHFPLTEATPLELTIDQVVAADPDVLFYTDAVAAPNSVVSICSDARWVTLKAIATNKAFLMPTTDNLGYGPADYRLFLADVTSATD